MSKGKRCRKASATPYHLGDEAEIGGRVSLFVLRESVFGQDADFRRDSDGAYKPRWQSPGNLGSRVLAMQQKYFAGVVQAASADWAPEDLELRDKFTHVGQDVESFMVALQFHRALEALWSALDHANRYIVQTAPFTLIKDPAQQSRVGAVLHHLLEAVRMVSRLLAPFMPDTAMELRSLLGLEDNTATLSAPWGEGFAPGHKVSGAKNLFPRIESDTKK